MPADKLTDFDLRVLRMMNGKTGGGIVAGAAPWSALEYLDGRGLVSRDLHGEYTITAEGRSTLEAGE